MKRSIVIALALCMALCLAGCGSAGGKSAAGSAGAAASAAASASASAGAGAAGDAQSLQSENEQLKAENERLKSQLSAAQNVGGADPEQDNPIDTLFSQYDQEETTAGMLTVASAEYTAWHDELTAFVKDMRIDGELTLFDGVADRFGGLDASAALMERLTDGTFRRDEFAHEQDLLVTAEGKSILIAGCAHRGVVNIRNRAETLLGRPVDVIVGGFHLFELPPGDPDTDALIGRTARALTAGSTVFYTGHCTGEYAFEKMSAVLGGRLRRISCGSVTEL